jgi:hypothetical protein
LRFLKTIILLLVPLTGLTLNANAQISLTAENMALGGGGTAYLTGFEALFVNPANLYIQEKNYKLQISLLQGGAYFDTAIPIQNNNERFSRFRTSMLPYNQFDENRLISDGDRTSILERNYAGERAVSYLQSQTDLYWLGMKWNRTDRSYALALRTRTMSSYEIGRGYFSGDPVERNGDLVIDRSFRHQYQVLNELSFGYAESFTYLNGLIPRLSEFIVGIAPKIVLAGPHLDTEYFNVYTAGSDPGSWQREARFNQLGSGFFSEAGAQDLLPEATSPFDRASFSDLFNPSGVGIGLDIGITYLITFGSDLSVLRREDMPTEKSLRFSFSINDLGAVHHFRDSRTLTMPEIDEVSVPDEELSELYFQGAPNEHLFFLNQFSDSPFNRVDRVTEGAYETLLPTTINAGALFQINRLKMMGDISYNISQSRFSPNLPVTYLGIEIRPLSFLPLRAGTRLAPGLPGYYSFGGAIETTYFDLTAAVQLKSRNIGPTTEILGASLVGIKFYLQ